LAAVTGVPIKSLMRMVSASGNPRAENLFAILGALQEATGVHLSVSAAA
jgi:DNA-binding phage protein